MFCFVYMYRSGKRVCIDYCDLCFVSYGKDRSKFRKILIFIVLVIVINFEKFGYF